MKNQEKEKNILIVALTAIATVLALSLLFVCIKNNKLSKCQENIKYRHYEDSLIEKIASSDFDIITNTINNYSNIAILLTSKIDEQIIAEVKINMTDDSNNSVKNITRNILLNNKASAIVIENIPELTSQYAGKIQIEVNKVDNVNVDSINFDQFTYNLNEAIIENNITQITIDWNNNSKDTVKTFGGNIVAIKDNKIVDIASFYAENILSGANFKTTSNLKPKYTSEKTTVLEYDELKVCIQAAEK